MDPSTGAIDPEKKFELMNRRYVELFSRIQGIRGEVKAVCDKKKEIEGANSEYEQKIKFSVEALKSNLIERYRRKNQELQQRLMDDMIRLGELKGFQS